MKQYRAIIWTIIGLFVILIFQTNGFTNFEFWLGYFNGIKAWFPKAVFFRDNSIRSFIYNSFRVIGVNVKQISSTLNIIVSIGTISVISWFIIRFLKREITYQSYVKNASRLNDVRFANIIRTYGHFTDSLALILLAAPTVWEHYYVFAIPVILFYIATKGDEKKWQIGIAAFLMFVIPIFDVFPFSYHRLAGLLWLLYVTSAYLFPTKVPRNYNLNRKTYGTQKESEMFLKK